MLKDLVLNNRSYRAFDESRRVSREELAELVDLARLTASSANRQVLRYRLVWEREEAERVLGLTKWAALLAKLNLPRPGTHPAAFIVICQDVSEGPGLKTVPMDVGVAAQTLLLGAVEKGLGGCMIGNYSPAAMSEALGLPETLEPKLVVAIGKPAEQVILTEVGPDGSTNYYRDESGTIHYVPKRKLEDVIL